MVFSINLSKKQTRILLEDPRWTLDRELTDQVSVYGGMVYHNADGRAMENVEPGGGLLFDSRAECLKHIEDFFQAFEIAKIQGSLSYMIPQGQNFISEVPELINRLALQLKVPREDLDKSQNSMNRVEKSVKRIGRKKCQQPEFFAPLVAYVGEVIRQVKGGQWALRFSDDDQVWEPWIIDAHGEAHPFFILLQKAFEETPYSIVSVTSAAIEMGNRGWVYGREQGWEINDWLKIRQY